jgi:hypothetical protein
MIGDFIPDPDLDFLRIPDPKTWILGPKKTTDPGSRIRNTDFTNTHTSFLSTTKVAKFFSYIKIR